MSRYHSFLHLLVAAVLIAGISVRSSAQAALDVAVSGGTITGATAKGVDTWLGIPYAAPPVGPLRWQPPQPVISWTKPLKANALSDSCAQNVNLGAFYRMSGSEDCLYLNIYRDGAFEPGQKLPVLIWIHGGGFQTGAASEYDPAKIVKRGKMIVVTINYRLGVFGFFAHPALNREGHDFANYGLMDQQAALSWVHENIARFGGDPDNVTLAGQSAGGNSALLHIGLPFFAGKFQNAIVMSGGTIVLKSPLPGAPRSLAVGEQEGLGFANSVNCAGDDDKIAAACMRALSTKRVLEGQTPYAVDSIIIDGTVVPRHPNELLSSRQISPVTLINGTTRDEGRLYIGMQEVANGRTMTSADYPGRVMGFFGSEFASRVLAEYPLDAYDSASEAYSTTMTDACVCASRHINRLLARKMPVFAYEFNDGTAPSPIGPTTFPMRDAHGFELQYLFTEIDRANSRSTGLNPFQERLSDQMVDDFARPAKLRSEWTPFDAKRDNVMTYQLPSARMVTGRFDTLHHCAFWDKVGIY